MQFKSMVVLNEQISPGYCRIRLTAPREIMHAKPGQFVMVRVYEGIDPLLRRPFGIYDLGSFEPEYPDAPKQHYIEILYKVVGRGTGILLSLHRNDYLDVLGPLGNGFDQGSPDQEKILVGGGFGLAPLYFLAKQLVPKSKVKVFIGGRRKEDILCVTEFERLGIEAYVATDDGTLGSMGLVTEVLENYLAGGANDRTIIACGPGPMLKSAAAIAERHGISCQVSLESNMACGVGACLGCVTKGSGHSDENPDYRCVCKDGPVFDAREILWE
jgi:dihydroorotate dehydrogenase electron transfer subunit